VGWGGWGGWEGVGGGWGLGEVKGIKDGWREKR